MVPKIGTRFQRWYPRKNNKRPQNNYKKTHKKLRASPVQVALRAEMSRNEAVIFGNQDASDDA